MAAKRPARKVVPEIGVKRAYEPATADDGLRVLVDRLWPRGLTKAEARIDLWPKNMAPSDTLRRLVHGDPSKWKEFVMAYARELKQEPAKSAFADLHERCKKERIILVYAARDESHNHAVLLKRWLEQKIDARGAGIQETSAKRMRA
jgi:uncharacterized protein YeaO (DUF488 family)